MIDLRQAFQRDGLNDLGPDRERGTLRAVGTRDWARRWPAWTPLAAPRKVSVRRRVRDAHAVEEFTRWHKSVDGSMPGSSGINRDFRFQDDCDQFDRHRTKQDGIDNVIQGLDACGLTLVRDRLRQHCCSEAADRSDMLPETTGCSPRSPIGGVNAGADPHLQLGPWASMAHSGMVSSPSSNELFVKRKITNHPSAGKPL